MLAKPKEPRIPLPKGWPGCVKSAVFHSIAPAHYALARARAGRRQHQCPECDSQQRTTSFELHAAHVWLTFPPPD